jgi:hypothetical protein
MYSNQTIEIDNEIEQRKYVGVGFIFHPDLISNFIERQIKNYSFSITKFQKHFIFRTKKKIFYWSVQKIQSELEENIDT